MAEDGDAPPETATRSAPALRGWWQKYSAIVLAAAAFLAILGLLLALYFLHLYTPLEDEVFQPVLLLSSFFFSFFPPLLAPW